MTLRDGEKRLIYKDNQWQMTIHTSDEYTLETTLTMYHAVWRVVKIEPHEDNLYTYHLVELSTDNDNKPDTP